MTIRIMSKRRIIITTAACGDVFHRTPPVFKRAPRMFENARTVLFFASALAAIACFGILVSGVCPRDAALFDTTVRHDLLFVSEYMSICLQSPLFNPVPWLLALAVSTSALCILLSWEAYTMQDQQYTLLMHMLVFHFCLNMACVAEFRTDCTASVANGMGVIPDSFGNEAFAHKFAAVQAILDFACVHLIIVSHLHSGTRAGGAECQGPQRGPQHAHALYRQAEVLYVVFTYLFIVCWVVQSMLAAAVFEWLLVLCAFAMQGYAIQRSAYACGDARPAHHFVKIFSERWLRTLLGLYVALNLVTVAVLTPPRWAFGAASEKTEPDAVLYTGGEFWLLVAFATTVVGGSVRAHASGESERGKAASMY